MMQAPIKKYELGLLVALIGLAVQLLGINLVCAQTFSSNDPSLPHYIKKVVNQVDELLAPIMRRPDVTFEISKDKNSAVPGMRLVKISTTNPWTIAHEYSHTYFDENFEIMTGKTFRTYFEPYTRKILELSAERRGLRLSDNYTFEKKQRVSEIENAITDLSRERAKIPLFRQHNELFADLIPVLIMNDPDYAFSDLIAELSESSTFEANERPGRSAYFRQRSFRGDPRFVLLDENALLYDGTDSYSSLNAGRIAIGTLMSAQMNLQSKQRLIQNIKPGIEAHIQQIIGSGKTLRTISYADLNKGFIEAVEASTGVKLPAYIWTCPTDR